MTSDKRQRRAIHGDNSTPVDATLERSIESVVQAVDDYLAKPGDAQREELVSQLTALDDQLSRSDAYESNILGSGVFGIGSKGAVIGETSAEPLVQVVPTDEFTAQIALVKAAKLEITAGSPLTMDDLRAARQALPVH
jgi:hypothetical protein